MHKVASYILSLQGSNPPNGKAPQGDLYVPEQDNTVPEAEMGADSTSQAETIGMN